MNIGDRRAGGGEHSQKCLGRGMSPWHSNPYTVLDKKLLISPPSLSQETLFYDPDLFHFTFIMKKTDNYMNKNITCTKRKQRMELVVY